MTGKRSAKRSKKSRRGPRPGNGINVPLDGAFPRAWKTKLNYSDVITMTEGAAGAGSNYVYRASCVYDPDYTGVGHQPLYFDQLCTSTGPYMNFCVPAAKFELRFSNVSAYPALITVLTAPYTTVPASRTLAAERPGTWKHLLAPVGTGGAAVTKVLKLNNTKLSGMSLDTFQAALGGNYSTSSGGLSAASFPHYVNIIVWGAGGIASVVCEVNIVYTTRFFNLGAIAAS